MSDMVKRLRFRIGAWILGGDWYGVIMRLWLIRDRAMDAVNRDGRVVLARCGPLSEALYKPIPGNWTLTVTRFAPPISDTGDKT